MGTMIHPSSPSPQVLTQKLGRSKAALQETLLRLSRSNLQKSGQVGQISAVFCSFVE